MKGKINQKLYDGITREKFPELYFDFEEFIKKEFSGTRVLSKEDFLRLPMRIIYSKFEKFFKEQRNLPTLDIFFH